MRFIVAIVLALCTYLPAHAAIDVAINRVPISISGNLTTGLKTITFTDFSEDCTVVPCAAIFLVNRGHTEDTEVAGATISLGFTDGLNQRVISVRDANQSSGTVNSNREQRLDRVIQMLGDTGVQGSAMFYDWLQNGLRLDITQAPPSAVFITAVLIGGTDLLANVGHFRASATVDTATDVTSVGFLSDVVFLMGSRLDATAGTSFVFTFGAAVRDGSDTQGSIGCTSSQGQSTTDPHAITSTLYAASYALNRASMQVSSFDSSGFTGTTRVIGNASDYHYLALKFNGPSSSVIDIDTRTTTGETSHSLGYRPLFATVLGTLARAYDVDEADSDAGQCMIAFATVNNQYSALTGIRDGVTPSQTYSLSNDQAIVMELDDGTCAAGSCFRGHAFLEQSSLDLNYTSVFTNAVRKWVGFTLEDVATTGGHRRGVGILQ